MLNEREIPPRSRIDPWTLPEKDFWQWLDERALHDPLLKAARESRRTFQDDQKWLQAIVMMQTEAKLEYMDIATKLRALVRPEPITIEGQTFVPKSEQSSQ